MPGRPRPISLPDTEIRLFESTLVNDTYRLYIALPERYNLSDKVYPVVYVADGNELTPLVRFIVRALHGDWHIPRVIVVGIGYDTDHLTDLWRARERDFVPTNDPSYLKQHRRKGYPVGQADTFLRFIREELQPFIDEHYRTVENDTTYMGNSHGGLFGLYTLFEQPNTFQRYVISSPSIHHDDGLILKAERTYAEQHTDLSVRLFLSVGAREEIDDPLIAPSFKFVSNVQALSEALSGRRYPNLHLSTAIIKGETHASVIPAAFTQGLRFVFSDR